MKKKPQQTGVAKRPKNIFIFSDRLTNSGCLQKPCSVFCGHGCKFTEVFKFAYFARAKQDEANSAKKGGQPGRKSVLVYHMSLILCAKILRQIVASITIDQTMFTQNLTVNIIPIYTVQYYHVNISDLIFKSLFGSVMKKNCLAEKVISSVRENPFNRKRALFLLSQRSSSSGRESHFIGKRD